MSMATPSRVGAVAAQAALVVRIVI
jgi:hypothetical protein